MNQKLITAGVVFAGLVAISLATYLKAPPELIAAGSAALLIIAGSLKSMILGDTKP